MAGNREPALPKARNFRGLKEGALKAILKNRFADLKKAHEATLRRGKPPDWTDKLILDKNGARKRLQQVHGHAVERHLMWDAALGALGRNDPERIVEVDLAPRHVGGLALFVRFANKGDIVFSIGWV